MNRVVVHSGVECNFFRHYTFTEGQQTTRRFDMSRISPMMPKKLLETLCVWICCCEEGDV